MEASLIAYARNHMSAATILRQMHKDNIKHIKVKGIETNKFLLTFDTKEDKENMDLGWLDNWFSSFTEVSHKDLNLPRKAWLNCDGLPISLWNKSKWELIVKEWGTFIEIASPDPYSDTLSNPAICIYTQQVKKIKETIKVLVGKESYWIVIKETHRIPNLKEDRSQFNEGTSEESLAKKNVSNRNIEATHNEKSSVAVGQIKPKISSEIKSFKEILCSETLKDQEISQAKATLPNFNEVKVGGFNTWECRDEPTSSPNYSAPPK